VGATNIVVSSTNKKEKGVDRMKQKKKKLRGIKAAEVKK
jgi:hypothetical protein